MKSTIVECTIPAFMLRAASRLWYKHKTYPMLLSQDKLYVMAKRSVAGRIPYAQHIDGLGHESSTITFTLDSVIPAGFDRCRVIADTNTGSLTITCVSDKKADRRVVLGTCKLHETQDIPDLETAIVSTQGARIGTDETSFTHLGIDLRLVKFVADVIQTPMVLTMSTNMLMMTPTNQQHQKGYPANLRWHRDGVVSESTINN